MLAAEARLRGVPPGKYRVQADLAGFASVIVQEVELLVGQHRTVPFSMKVAALQETVTVTGESPLVDISSTQVAATSIGARWKSCRCRGATGSNWRCRCAGVTANAVDEHARRPASPVSVEPRRQEIAQQVAGSGFGQPRFSREAIAEFQVVTNLFDITQGRSLGMQVQAISRSGTNNLNGSVYGFFRDDGMNARVSSPIGSCRIRISSSEAAVAGR